MPRYTPLDIAIAVIVVVIIPALSAWTGRTLAHPPAEGRHLTARYWWVIVRSAIVSLLVVGTWLRLGRPFGALGLDIPISRWGRVGFGIDAAIAAYYLYAIVLRRRSAEELHATRERLRDMQSDRMLPQTRSEYLLFPVVAIVGSSFEELVYRGFLIWFFTPIGGVFGAILLSSLAFGFGHAYLGRLGVIRTAGIGVVFGVAYALTRSLWWVMLAHVTVNLFGVPLQRRLQRSIATQPT